MSLRDWFERQTGVYAGEAIPSQICVKNAHEAGEAARALHAIPLLLAPSREGFAAWRDDPVTSFVMRALEHNAGECREEWLRKSWNTGEADQLTLVGLRERADALLGFTADYEAFCETLGLEPEQEEQAA